MSLFITNLLIITNLLKKLSLGLLFAYWIVLGACNSPQKEQQQTLLNTTKPAPEQQEEGITPKWGKRYYKAHNGETEAIEHIWLRHNHNTTYNNVSKFDKRYNSREAIKNLVTDALKKAKKSDISIEAGGHKTITTDLKTNVGTDIKGKFTTKIRIHLDHKDFVKTAYPY